MGWEDYLNPIQDVKRAKDYFFDAPAKERKAALDQAAQVSDVDTQKLVDFYMQQQKQAVGYYKPLQTMFNNAYGTGGLRAPVMPQRTLGNMYGGGQ